VGDSQPIIQIAEPNAAPAVRRGFYFPLNISERKLLLMALDLLALCGSLVLITMLRPEYAGEPTVFLRRPYWLLTLALVWLLLAHGMDLYDLRVAGRFTASIPSIVLAGMITTVGYLFIPFITPAPPASHLLMGAFPLLSTAMLLAGRFLYTRLLAQPVFQQRVLIVGAGWAGRTIAEALARTCRDSVYIVGFVDDDAAKQGSVVEVGEQRVRVLGGRRELKPLIGAQRVTTLVLAITHEIEGELFQTLMDCLEFGVEIVPMPVLYEQLTGKVPVEHIGDNWYVAMPIDHPGTKRLNRLIKRLTDVVLASLGLLLLLPFLPILALAIYIDSPGPIFYTQERVGEGGKIFKVYKFRSMVPDAEKGEAVWAQENDPRVTRVGRLLRKTHVDEFPQFLNILKGEMSAVGPRPERPEFVAELAEEIPFYRTRHAVKPGMAGWSLVKYGYASSKEDAKIKIQYDLYYIKHQSFWLDMVILIKTIIDTITLRGRA
jgi:exopolysaccharide biosynthesis polyprenyl glycosylphosphotransferase